MTWLLHQFQKVLGALTGSRRRADISAPTQFGDKAAARLQQGRTPDPDAPVAKRVSGSQPSEPSAETSPSTQPITQSTAPLRQKSSSVLKDTVDPVAAEPDTHRRLDAAPAARPGGKPATPSFPTDVSELISSQSPLSPELKKDAIGDLSIPNVEDPADQQLPDIHDLLPAIEPDEADAPLSEKSLDDEDLREHEQTADGLEEKDTVEESSVEEAPVVESAERVTAGSDQATLFSFDITESDIAESDIASDADVVSDDDVSQSLLTENQPAVSSDASEPAFESTSELAVENSAPMLEDSNARSEAPAPPVTETAQIDSDRLEPNNPWLTATPSPTKQPSEPTSTAPTATKQGSIKLLFMLKPGNFHGYIAPEDGSKDILFHQKYINADIFDELERGARVVATVKTIEGKVYATRVDLLQE